MRRDYSRNLDWVYLLWDSAAPEESGSGAQEAGRAVARARGEGLECPAKTGGVHNPARPRDRGTCAGLCTDRPRQVRPHRLLRACPAYGGASRGYALNRRLRIWRRSSRALRG